MDEGSARLTRQAKEQGKQATGRVTEDPTKSSEIGDTIHFKPVAFPVDPGFAEGFNTINNWGYFGGVILMLTMRIGDTLTVEGTAVMIAPGIALTAAHTVQPHLQSLAEGKSALTLSAIRENDMMFWTVASITTADSDIAILCLKAASALPNDRTYQQATLTTRTPRTGESVTIVGFRFDRSALFDGGKYFEFEGHGYVARGKVSDIYEQGRDRVMIRWPSFQIDAKTVGSMSGAPVFDVTGAVIGLLSSSIESDEGNGPSYASLLWPCLGFRIAPVWPEGLIKSPQSLATLDPRICVIIGRDALIPDAASKSSSWAYRPWDRD
ncbi:trypsin-like peptidase [Mesorhizobium loti]|uniref:Trypsin-like peptidase n=1 Tax=Rhizobium loti TaxID=381 RepID=A0A8E2WCY6_RHILI|nr:serine protease [Mesorhizobium loti]PWJ91697.1 trypsin-like peptidase [Mesorhizobium loti]